MAEWRKIPGFPDRFEVSDEGEIRTLAYEVKFISKDGTAKTRAFGSKPITSRAYDGGKSKGHPVVTLSGLTNNNTKIGEQRVSLLVARAFHGCPYTPGDLKQCQKWRIMHLDGDITNNRAENLEWVSSNGGSTDTAAYKLYESNLREMERRRREPAILWARKIFGEDFQFDEEEELADIV